MNTCVRVATVLWLTGCGGAGADSVVSDTGPTPESVVSDTGPTPEWVLISVTVAFAGEACSRGFDATLPGDPWRIYVDEGCDEAVRGTQDVYGNWWFFFSDCNGELARDPLFGPSAEWINAEDDVPPPCPEDPSFSWTYPEELLVSEAE
jgi:hypothetical protein